MARIGPAQRRDYSLAERKECSNGRFATTRPYHGKQSGGRMSCKTACDIVDHAGIPRRRIGQLLDEMKIKIHSCQLGCFD